MAGAYRDLKVWQKSLSLAEASYGATKQFPKEEMYGLTSQIRRCAVSVAANIAEGYGRDSNGAFVQFLRVSQGSLKEFETHVILSERIGLLAKPDAGALLESADEVGRMLRGLIQSVLERPA